MGCLLLGHEQELYTEVRRKLLLALFVFATAVAIFFILFAFFFMRNEMTWAGSVICGIFGSCGITWIWLPPLYMGTINV